mgnify:CR=1 FL=1
MMCRPCRRVEPVSGKNAATADECPVEQAPIPLSEVGSRGRNSIPFALLSLVCLVCFLRHNSKSKRIYAIMAVN